MSFLRRTDVFMESMSPARESAPPFSGYGATSQGFGAVGDPSSAARAPAAAAAPRANSGPHTPGPHPLSPARRSGLAFVGHPQHQHHLNPIISSPADSSTADNFLRPPPVSGTGTGSGPGSRSGLGFGTNAPGSARRAVSAAVSYGNPYPQHQDASPAALAPSSATSPSRARRPQSSTYRSVSFAPRGQYSPTRASHHQDRRAPAHPNALVPGLRTPTGSGAGSDTGPALTLGARPMFDLPSIPTSTDDFASIPYLNPDTSSASASTAPKDTMSQPPQQQQQYAAAQRRTTGYGEEQQQHHMQGSGQYQQHGPMSPRDYPAPAGGPHITLDQAPGSSSYQGTPSSYTSGSAVPSVLQPGGALARPPATNATSSLLQGSTQQQQDYQTPGRPSLSMSHNHSYSRSSPSAGYDAPNPGFSPYTPTTPSGPGSSSAQFMSPTDRNYNAPGSQRNMSHTPLGLADIRPRADSSLSDGMPSGLDFHSQNAPPGPSNYMAPWTSYAFDWCKWAPQGNGAGKVAIGSYLEDGHNFIQILDTQIVPTPPDVYNTQGGSKWTMDFTKVAEATHSYPVTRLLWEPPSTTKQSTDLLATSGDHLRLWSLPSETTAATPGNSITSRSREVVTTKLTPLALLSNSKTPDHTAPLTSLDWNTVSPSLIITSSIDTTCTIWDIPSLTAKTQLIAHDKEVYDVRFCANSVDVFVSCGQDGSVRMFDLRSLEHSTIIYEPTGKEDRVDANGGRISPTLAQQTMSNPPPLLRLATSPHDTQLLATFAQDSSVIRILDTRQPGQALLELRGHGGAVNCVDWSPTRRGQLASGGDDCQVLIWDLMNQPQSNGGSQTDNIRSPASSWHCDYEVGNLGWVPRLPNDESSEWLGVSAGRGIWGVKL